MTVGFAFLVGFLPLALVYVVSDLLRKAANGIRYDRFDLFFSLMFSLPGFVVPFAWQTHWKFGFACALSAYCVAVLFIGASVSEKIEGSTAAQGVGILSLAASMILSIVAVPVSVLPELRAGPSTSSAGKVESESVADISLIEGKFSDLQQVLQTEGEKIQASLESVLEEVEKQNAELQQLRAEELNLKAELETYKKLLELEEPQVQAIQSLLNRGKYLDYGVGFLLGLLSSAAVAYSPSLLGRRGRGGGEKDVTEGNE